MKNRFNASYVGLRQDIISHIDGNNNLILDVGCSSGTNGSFLLKSNKAKKVYGIEYSKEMSESAAENGLVTYCGDLNNIEFRRKIIAELPPFDFIIFGDILEHLIDPEEVLKEFSQKLRLGGKIIISLPNIAHIELLIQVFLKGTWPRNKRGIFDKTHLRWFTRKDAFEMLGKAGLYVLKYDRNFRARDFIGSEFNWKYKILRLLNKDWVTFQYIIIASNVSN